MILLKKFTEGMKKGGKKNRKVEAKSDNADDNLQIETK